MPLDYATVKNWRIDDVDQSYDARDTILYNLGVGAGVVVDAAQADLDYVWEERLKAVPTMAAVLGEGPIWMRDPASTISWRDMVHAHQSIVWHRPVPTAGRIRARSEVEEVFDKGAARGAILVIRRDLHDMTDGRPIATIRIGIFLRSDGGFGGQAVSPPPRPSPGDRVADQALHFVTRPEQALIYRLSGDLYPLHVDPVFARAAGFDGPILHGLATYGVAARGIVELLCGQDPGRLRRLDARFTAPVRPGDGITLELWHQGDGAAAFRCRVGERIVLDQGWAEAG